MATDPFPGPPFCKGCYHSAPVWQPLERGMKTEEFGRQGIDALRDVLAKRRIEQHGETGCGHSFSELLCHDLHTTDGETYGGHDFVALAERWGVAVEVLGLLIADHCYGLAGRRPERWSVTRVKDMFE